VYRNPISSYKAKSYTYHRPAFTPQKSVKIGIYMVDLKKETNQEVRLVCEEIRCYKNSRVESVSVK